MSAILQPTAGTVSDLARESSFASAALDQVFIEGLTAQTVIGIHDSELHAPQPVVLDGATPDRAVAGETGTEADPTAA